MSSSSSSSSSICLTEDEIQKYQTMGDIHVKIMNDIETKFYKKEFTSAYEIKKEIETQIGQQFNLSNIYNKDRLKKGLAFPISVSVDHVAAHNTPHPTRNNTLLTENSLIKIDFGLHDTGRIIDSARTLCLTDKYKPLQEASQEALMHGIRASGPDVLLSDIGKEIEEIIKSYEIEISPGDIQPLVPVFDLCGHNIGIFRPHNNKAVPNVHYPQYQLRMSANEIFAIEPFVTWGSHECEYVSDNCNHFTIPWIRLAEVQKYIKEKMYVPTNDDEIVEKANPIQQKLRELYSKHYTLPFSPYDEPNESKIDEVIQMCDCFSKSYLQPLSIVKTFNPTAQYEKTLAILENERTIVFT